MTSGETSTGVIDGNMGSGGITRKRKRDCSVAGDDSKEKRSDFVKRVTRSSLSTPSQTEGAGSSKLMQVTGQTRGTKQRSDGSGSLSAPVSLPPWLFAKELRLLEHCLKDRQSENVENVGVLV